MKDELKKVIDIVFDRMKDRDGEGDSFFIIPEELLSPENITKEEKNVVETAGFIWTEEEEFRGYMMKLN